MTTIVNSEVIESVDRVTYRRNRYRYTLSTGDICNEIGWPVATVSNAVDMALRGELLLQRLAENEIDQLLASG